MSSLVLTLSGRTNCGAEFHSAWKSFRHLWSYAYQDFDRRALRHGLAHVSEHLGIAAADYRLDGGAVVPVDYVVSGEKVGGGDSHGAQLAEGQHREPVLIAALEDEHHHIPAAYAEGLEICRRPVGLFLEVAETEAYAAALVVGPEQGEFVGLFFSPDIHHVIGEVEVFRNPDVEVADEVLL